MKIDTVKYLNRVRALEAEIRAQKTWIKEGGEKTLMQYDWKAGKKVPTLVKRGAGMGYMEDYQQLEALSLEATMLYTLRACLRGKAHLIQRVSHSPTGVKTVEPVTKESQDALILPESYWTSTYCLAHELAPTGT